MHPFYFSLFGEMYRSCTNKQWCRVALQTRFSRLTARSTHQGSNDLVCMPVDSLDALASDVIGLADRVCNIAWRIISPFGCVLRFLQFGPDLLMGLKLGLPECRGGGGGGGSLPWNENQ